MLNTKFQFNFVIKYLKWNTHFKSCLVFSHIIFGWLVFFLGLTALFQETSNRTLQSYPRLSPTSCRTPMCPESERNPWLVKTKQALSGLILSCLSLCIFIHTCSLMTKLCSCTYILPIHEYNFFYNLRNTTCIWEHNNWHIRTITCYTFITILCYTFVFVITLVIIILVTCVQRHRRQQEKTRPNPKCFIFWPISKKTNFCPFKLVLWISKKLTFFYLTSSFDTYHPKNLLDTSKVSKELDFCKKGHSFGIL